MRDDGEESVLGLVRVAELAPRFFEGMKDLLIGPHVAQDPASSRQTRRGSS